MRLHLLRHARIATLCATVLVAFVATTPATAHAATQGCADDAAGITDLTSSWEAQLLQLTNAHRTGMGLVALQLDTTLTRASVWKARDMARRDYFTHDDPANGTAPARSPWDRLEACGWNTGGSRAENIAAGYSSAAEVVQGWLDSPGHRANIENSSMRYVGFGVASSTTSSYTRYQVQMFASVAGPTTTTPISQPPTGDGTTTDGGGTEGTGDETREPLEQERVATTIADPFARVVRARCGGRLAVQGWCYRLVVRARVSSQQAGNRFVVLSRRTASGRLVRIGSLRTPSTGRFYRSIALKPPTRNTTTWLRRNATIVRMGVAGTATARPTVRWTTGQLALRRR